MAYPQNYITTIQDLFNRITINLENPGENASILFENRAMQTLDTLPETFQNSVTNDQLCDYIAEKIQSGNHVYIFEKDSTYPFVLHKGSNNQIVVQPLRELEPAPEPPQKPNIWKRFANTITGGNAYRNDIENYRNYQAQMKDREEMEIALDGAAYPMYKRNEALEAAAKEAAEAAANNITIEEIEEWVKNTTPEQRQAMIDVFKSELMDGSLDIDSNDIHAADGFEQNNLEVPDWVKNTTPELRQAIIDILDPEPMGEPLDIDLDGLLDNDHVIDEFEQNNLEADIKIPQTAKDRSKRYAMDLDWYVHGYKQPSRKGGHANPEDKITGQKEKPRTDLDDLLDNLNKPETSKTSADTPKQIPFEKLVKEDTVTVKPTVSKSSSPKEPAKDRSASNSK